MSKEIEFVIEELVKEMALRLMDERGQKVEIQKAKVNGEDGLFFLFGSTHVAILNKDILYLHGVSHKPSNNLIDSQGKKSYPFH